MNGFRVFVDFAQGEAFVEGGRGVREPHPSGLILAADARLDNRQELLAALDSDHHGSPEDADLILAAYLKWGEGCPERLLGDFAFVVWDPRSRRLFAARDQIGVRPLHYTLVGSLLGVASDARSLLQHPRVPRRVDLVAVGDYLSQITSEPERTFFQDVHRVPPAHALTATARDLRIHRYWDVVGLPPLNLSAEDASRRFLELFRLAVRDRLDTSDGSGVAMSGGLDSTSIAAVASRELAERGAGPLKACSFIFNELKNCDERPSIDALARTFGLETSFIDTERFWFLGDDEAYTPPLDTPAISWESPFQQMLHAFQQAGGRVLLTGHGADDLLLGSRFVYVDRLRRGDLRVFSDIWRHSHSRRYGWRPFYRLLVEPQLGTDIALELRRRFSRSGPLQMPAWITPGFARSIRLAERLAEAASVPRQRTAFGQMHQRLVSRPSYHRSIEWYERNSRPLGIEVRHPFLDRRLFELVFALRPDHLFRLGERKTLLRQAVAGVLPDFVRLQRKKVTLGGFIDFSMKKEADQVRRLFSEPLSAKLGIVHGEKVRDAFERYLARGVDGGRDRSLWYVVTLELWLRRHLYFFDEISFDTMAFTGKVA
jgi:asparagine synthase (glutamine-hydrolysing)